MKPLFTITNAIASAITKIERARGFLDAARLSADWITEMQARALVLEAHYTTHIEGTHLTLEQSERLLAGQPVPEADPNDARELLNYREAFDLVAGLPGQPPAGYGRTHPRNSPAAGPGRARRCGGPGRVSQGPELRGRFGHWRNGLYAATGARGAAHDVRLGGMAGPGTGG